jgi:hypothetical protein
VVRAGEVATVWAFNFFFYNKKLKRILYIGVKAVSKTAAEEEKVSRQLDAVHSGGLYFQARAQQGLGRGGGRL